MKTGTIKTTCTSLALSMLMVATVWAGELDAFAGKKGKIDIAGGTAHIPVMKDAAKRVMQANPDIRISVAITFMVVATAVLYIGCARLLVSGRGMRT